MGGQESSLKPRMIQILHENDEGGIELRPGCLEKILLDDDIINKPVIVISVTGAAGSGKSFLVGMMLHHLCNESKDYEVPAPTELTHTTGVLMWSRPFPVTLPTGEEAVIVLMDTEGTPGGTSGSQAHAALALGTLLSSTRVFNVTGDVGDEDLELLQPFTEYGRMMLDKTSGSPLQRLLFLVRDWDRVDQFPLGEEGGDRLVTKRLQKQSGKIQLADVCSHVGDCFGSIDGFLLPHPGEAVASRAHFDGDSDNMDPTFAAKLNELMSAILASENLAIKTIAGNRLTAVDLFTFFTSYLKLFPKDELPKPEEILQATAEASHMTAAQKAKAQYEEEMDCVLSDGKAPIDPDSLAKKHREAVTRAEQTFNDRKKIGDQKMSKEYLKTVVREIGEWFEEVAEKSRKKYSVCYVTELIDTCSKMYVSEMRTVVETASRVDKKGMDSAHHQAKEKAINKYDARIKHHSVAWDSRFKLAQVIGTHCRLMRHHNDMKRHVGGPEEAGASMKAVELARNCYQTVMAGSTSGTVGTKQELEGQHQKALQVAIAAFESLKKGQEHVTAPYLEGLKSIINEDFELKIYSLNGT